MKQYAIAIELYELIGGEEMPQNCMLQSQPHILVENAEKLNSGSSIFYCVPGQGANSQEGGTRPTNEPSTHWLTS